MTNFLSNALISSSFEIARTRCLSVILTLPLEKHISPASEINSCVKYWRMEVRATQELLEILSLSLLFLISLVTLDTGKIKPDCFEADWGANTWITFCFWLKVWDNFIV
jgi:hypothetical protein